MEARAAARVVAGETGALAARGARGARGVRAEEVRAVGVPEEAAAVLTAGCTQ